MAQILALRAWPVIFSREEGKAREKMPWFPIYQFNRSQGLMGTLNSFQPFLCVTAPCSGCSCPAPEGTGTTGVHGHSQSQHPAAAPRGRVPAHQETLETSHKGSPVLWLGLPAHAPHTRRLPKQGLLSDRKSQQKSGTQGAGKVQMHKSVLQRSQGHAGMTPHEITSSRESGIMGWMHLSQQPRGY